MILFEFKILIGVAAFLFAAVLCDTSAFSLVGGAEPPSTTILNSRTAVPSIFVGQEERYDIYSACLAATCDLRRRYKDDSSSKTYARHAAKILKSLGMSTEEYNAIGHQLASDAILKDMVCQ